MILLAIGGMTAAYLRWPVLAQHAVQLAETTRNLIVETGSSNAPQPVPAAPAATVARDATATASRGETTTTTAPSFTPPNAGTTATAAPAAPPANTTETVARQPVLPSFDIVRVTPEGNAVIAGRAEPGARVIVHDGDHALGEAQADRNGEFVIVPAGRVAPGGRELTLSARDPDGHEVHGQDSVVVMVGPPTEDAKPPETPAATTATAEATPPELKPTEPKPTEPKPTVTAAREAPIAVLVPHDDTAPQMLQAPQTKPQALALNSVDYNDQGDIRFSGSAKPSAPVRVYVDNKPVGETNTDHAGQWTLTPPDTVQPGVHQLRVDELAGSGHVQNRVELPFQRTATPLAGLSPGQMVVQPGNNLWRIARQTYGAGARYTVIFLANREQIRDPNRIYPGQVFAVPTEP